jgi:hypothetical protein
MGSIIVVSSSSSSSPFLSSLHNRHSRVDPHSSAGVFCFAFVRSLYRKTVPFLDTALNG